MTRVPDCLTCGACCVSPFLGEGYIQVEEAEEGRLSKLGLPVLTLIEGPPADRVALLGTRLNKQRLRVCVALAGEVGKSVSCKVYEDRPGLCRQFEAGSPECLQARRAAGIATPTPE